MRAEGIAVLFILIFGIGAIGFLTMPMFQKMPTSTNPVANATVTNVTIPFVSVLGQGLSGLEIGLIIGAVIAVIIFVYYMGFNR